MRLIVLGNNGPYPAQNGGCSGYLLESDSGNTRVLIECGTGTLARLSSYCSPEDLTAVVLSHLHYDHMSDMLPMHYALQFSARKRPLDIYSPLEPSDIRALLRGPKTDVWKLRDTQLGEMKLTVCAGRHPVESYAIRIECDRQCFVYTGDTNTEPALELFCDGADLLLADAGLSSGDWSEKAPHLSAGLCGQLAASAHAKSLLLTHLNPKYDPEELLQEAVTAYPDAQLARIGSVYYL